jgi:MFS transporter, ACS family, tartrate transporter
LAAPAPRDREPERKGDSSMKATANFSAAEAAVFGKVSRRFVWFILLLFMVNFVDRTNVGFAALTMNRSIGISASTFALSLTCFAIAYLLCEIPSNLILERVGARLWLARIAVTWGLRRAPACSSSAPRASSRCASSSASPRPDSRRAQCST